MPLEKLRPYDPYLPRRIFSGAGEESQVESREENIEFLRYKRRKEDERDAEDRLRKDTMAWHDAEVLEKSLLTAKKEERDA